MKSEENLEDLNIEELRERDKIQNKLAKQLGAKA